MCVFCYWGCADSPTQSRQVSQGHLISCNPAHNDFENLSQLVDTTFYLPLESPPEHLIGSCTRLLAWENRFYIVDKRKTRSVFAFDRHGKFLFQIRRVGRGPGEYTEPYAFIINKQARLLEIYDRTQRKILSFDMQGNYLRERTFPWYVKDLIAVENNYLAYSTSYDPGYITHRLMLLSPQGAVLKQYLPFDQKEVDDLGVTNFSCQAGISFTCWRYNTVFHLQGQQLLPAYTIEYGPYSVLDDFFQHDIIEHQMELLKAKGLAHGISDMLETDRYLTFTYMYNGHSNMAFYSKRTQQLLSSSRCLNDIDGVPVQPMKTTYQEYLVSIIWPAAMERNLEMIQSDKFYRKVPVQVINRLKTLLKQTQPNSNPWLIFYKLKEF